MRTSSSASSAHPARKALYVALCSLLGVLLFVVLQRSLALIYNYALNANFETFSLGLSLFDLQMIDYITLLAAVLLGLWYGVWLGLHWYDMIYVAGPKAAGFRSAEVGDKPVTRDVLSREDQPAPWEMEDLMKEEDSSPVMSEEIKVRPVRGNGKSTRKTPSKRRTASRRTL